MISSELLQGLSVQEKTRIKRVVNTMRVGKLRAYLGLSISGLMLAANSAWAAQTLDYSIRWNTGDNRYHVYMKPTATPDPDGSISAQVTIRVPHATESDKKFNVSNLSSSISSISWDDSSRSDSPAEAPEYDYISFSLKQLDSPDAFNWQANEEQEVFSFANSGDCTGPISLMTDNDPFNVKNNSESTNPGNQFTNIGWSDFAGENSYRNIYGNNSADCRDSLDDDNDGLNNREERLYGTDPAIADTDGDGLSDGDEIYTHDTSPLKADHDDDGLPDGEEVNTYQTDPKQTDTDGDGLSDGDEVLTHQTDPLNTDSDGDTLTDDKEVNKHGTDPLKTDTDGDGLSDNKEINYYLTDPLKTDTDGDGLDDDAEVNTYQTEPFNTDSDGDGLSDGEEVNTHQTDPNNVDSDGDGLSDKEELEETNTDPNKADTDGDGLNDKAELGTHNTDPNVADSDNDGLSDGEEVNTYSTSPLDDDTDKDGLSDGEEVNTYGTDPLATDTDNDGLSDHDEVTVHQTDPLLEDGDQDGLTDKEELEDYDIDPNKADTDGDGLSDGDERYTYKTDPNEVDTDGDGLSDHDEVLVHNTNPLKKDSDGDGLSDFDEVNEYNTHPMKADTDGDGFTDGEEVEQETDPNKVNVAALSVKMLLQGAYSPDTQLMKDDLRLAELIPDTQPYNVEPINYTGTEMLNTDQLAVSGHDAIVDWVLVELRSALSKTDIVSRKAFLVQRDGDVVDPVTASSKLNFEGVEQGDYYVAVRHRNHLGVMTAAPVKFESTDVSVDFSAKDTLVEGDHARAPSKFKAMLWAGDANGDNRLIANGSGQDSGIVLVQILKAENNDSFNSNFIVNGYHVADFNMDGKVIFTGPNNDTNILISNIYSHPDNFDYNANYILRGQLPQ